MGRAIGHRNPHKPLIYMCILGFPVSSIVSDVGLMGRVVDNFAGGIWGTPVLGHPTGYPKGPEISVFWHFLPVFDCLFRCGIYGNKPLISPFWDFQLLSAAIASHTNPLYARFGASSYCELRIRCRSYE